MPMSEARQKQPSAPSGRRFLVHLLSAMGGESGRYRYIARIQPWVARCRSRAGATERVFADECELIEAINPLLPHGSDVRDVFEHIESPNGFFYLLRLSSEQAAQLGWHPDSTSVDAE
jgi:hypothetical protein